MQRRFRQPNPAYEWCRDVNNVVALGAWLISDEALETSLDDDIVGRFGEIAFISDAEGLQYYYEKPWKWTGEWHAYQAWQARRR